MNPSKTSLSQASKLLTKHNINNPELLQDIAIALDKVFEEAQEMINHPGLQAIKQYKQAETLTNTDTT